MLFVYASNILLDTLSRNANAILKFCMLYIRKYRIDVDTDVSIVTNVVHTIIESKEQSVLLYEQYYHLILLMNLVRYQINVICVCNEYILDTTAFSRNTGAIISKFCMLNV